MKKIIVIPALVATLGIGAAIGSTTLLSGNAEEKKVLSMQEIEKKALAVVDGAVTDIELDRSIYEVEVHTDTEEHDLKFDAYSGELLKQKKERRDDDDHDDWDDHDTLPASTKTITQEQAIKAAQTKAKGTVTKIELDDDGIYEIEFRDGQYEYDVDVDAITGKIIDFEQDIDD
ncbi:PepSY domain-containing protein [Lysinibacillus sp. FSL K6-0232]|uniref:PepSY domain-containing protein n=1 Tax=unclassified Lysinibacillus TaxID=2636778 RepID=UPI0030FB0934